MVTSDINPEAAEQMPRGHPSLGLQQKITATFQQTQIP